MKFTIYDLRFTIGHEARGAGRKGTRGQRRTPNQTRTPDTTVVSAFTLIELLAVIAIIGVLAGFLLVVTGGVQRTKYINRTRRR
jgi:prepilin-type N-terminal cleavage/methylation domain-containing protein